MALKLEKFIFCIFLFCLPLGTRKILWQWGGEFNEWTSACLYLTDILLCLIFCFWFWRRRKERFFQKINLKGEGVKSPLFWLVLFVLVCFVSLASANNFWLGIYRWLRILELVLLFLYIKGNVVCYSCESGNNKIALVLILSGLFQSMIAILQFGSQAALGLKWLGESPIGINVDGVAKIATGTVKMIRIYGTFPHSNVLAAFLLICLFSLIHLWLDGKKIFIKDCLCLFGFGLMIFALFLTFARLVLAVFFPAIFIYLLFVLWLARKNTNRELSRKIIFIFLILIIYSVLIICSAWPELFSRFTLSAGEQSVSLRSFYNQLAYHLIGENPWFGLGLGNFVSEIGQILNLMPSWVHQPVHNLYLLIAGETGLIGLFLFLMFLWRISVKRLPADPVWLFVLICFLFLGLFDHYFWTIWQGQLIFWLILGLNVYKREEVC